MAAGREGPDRREHQRKQVQLSARVRSEDGEVEAETLDLSEGGVLLSGDDLPTAQEVWIDLELADLGWRSYRGQVVRRDQANGQSRLAARLAEEALGGREALKTFLEDL